MRASVRLQRLRSILAVLFLAVLLRPPSGAAQPAAEHGAPEVPLQVFSTLDRSTVARSVVFVLEVAVYATPGSAEADARVAAAFAGAGFGTSYEGSEEALHAGAGDDLSGGLQFVRAEPVQRRDLPGDDGTEILVLERRYLFRALRAGVVEIPAWRMQVDGRTYAADGHRLHVYDIREDFYDAARQVFPVVARSRTADGGQLFDRTGSAFLVAPDALVTAYHVVMDAVDVRMTLPNGERLRLNRVWTIDPARDVALFYVDPDVAARAGLQPLRLAPFDRVGAPRSMQVRREEIVFTEGWPGGIQRATAGVYYRDLTFQPGEALWISTNPVRPGDSGGPLLDVHGDVLGVVSTGAQPGSDRGVPAEEVCVATDPRPALLQKLVTDRPRALRRYLRDPDFRADPHVAALRLAGLLSMQRRVPGIRRMLDDLDDALGRLSPPDAGLYFMRAALHEALRTRVDVRDAYRTAIEASDNQHLPAVYMLARLHLNERDYDGAAHLFGQMQASAPYRHLAAYGLARVLFARHRYADASRLFLDVLRFDPSFGPALFYLGLCHLARGDEAKAYQALSRLDPLSPFFAHRLRQALRYPILRPSMLEALPAAGIDLD